MILLVILLFLFQILLKILFLIFIKLKTIINNEKKNLLLVKINNF